MQRFAPIIFTLIPAVFSAYAQDPSEESRVRLQAMLASSTLHPGDSTEIQLTFAPDNDIHLSADPAVKIEIDSLSVLRKSGTLQWDADGRSGYVKTSHPLRQPVVLSPEVAPGRYPVQATVTYFYCSGSEGWCRKRVQLLRLEISARAPSPPARGG